MSKVRIKNYIIGNITDNVSATIESFAKCKKAVNAKIKQEG